MTADETKLAAEARRAVERWPDDWRHQFEERAAIKEYDAGMSRAKAEFEAFWETKRLKDAAR